MVFDIFAATEISQYCGLVAIERVLVGSRHGAVMRVTGTVCGYDGWLCLDPDAEFMSVVESIRLFDFTLNTAGQQVILSVYSNKKPLACGGNFPIVEDIRTPAP